MGSTKINRYKKRQTKKEKVWKYIRRNKLFRIGDVMVVLGLTQSYIKPVLWHLEMAGYIRLEEMKSKDYKDREYTMIKDTGVICPSMTNGNIYDHNTHESIDVDDALWIAEKQKLLSAMTENQMIKKEIVESVGMNIHAAIVVRCFKDFKVFGVTADGPRQRQTRTLYINKEKRDDFIAALSQGVCPARSA